MPDETSQPSETDPPSSRRAYLRRIVSQGLADTWRHLRREGIVLAIIVGVVASFAAWVRAGKFPLRWLYTRLPWHWHSAGQHVSVGDIFIPTLVALAVTAFLFLLWNCGAAPYRASRIAATNHSRKISDHTQKISELEGARAAAVTERDAATTRLAEKPITSEHEEELRTSLRLLIAAIGNDHDYLPYGDPDGPVLKVAFGSHFSSCRQHIVAYQLARAGREVASDAFHTRLLNEVTARGFDKAPYLPRMVASELWPNLCDLAYRRPGALTKVLWRHAGEGQEKAVLPQHGGFAVALVADEDYPAIKGALDAVQADAETWDEYDALRIAESERFDRMSDAFDVLVMHLYGETYRRATECPRCQVL